MWENKKMETKNSFGKDKALEKIHQVMIKAREKMSRVPTVDEGKKNEILGEVLFEIAMTIIDSPDVALLLPADYALYSFDELSTLVSRICLVNSRKVSYVA